MVTLTRIPGSFVTRVEAPRQLPAHDEALVWSIWQHALNGSDTLHDGRILTVSHVSETEVTVCPAAYRQWFAQFTNGVPLGIRPFAITGVLSLAEGFLMGRRSDVLLEDGGLWEFAPSGGVQAPMDAAARTMNPHSQLILEAQEELNLEADDLGDGLPFAILENEFTGVVDLVYLQHPKVSFATIRARAESARDREYTELQAIDSPWRKLEDGTLSPVAEALARDLQRRELKRT